MSHALCFAGKDGEQKVSFIYNSDLSGNVEIVVDSKNVEFVGDRTRVTIPGEELLNFVATIVSNEKISKLERMTPREVLGIK